MTDTSPTPQASLFDRMGGAPGVARLIDTFYDRMESLEQARAIRAMHPADLGPTREVFKRYLGEWLGGPALYSAEKGHPRLRMRHMHVAITSADRDAWLACMA
ncbi:MAG TPA: group II truncated hemoglobin, partial [Novosphingobium sp.]|nr:group II truncated hemoglobin [Novosphingobium sp.]